MTKSLKYLSDIMEKITILFAGGGTGGHTIPGICLANELKRIYPQAEIIFFVPGKPIDKEILAATPYPYYINSMTSFSHSLQALCKFPFHCIRSLWQTHRLFKKHSPNLVIALGGYASLSAGYYGYWKNIPIFALESNKIAGKTIKALAKISTKIYTPWQVDGLPDNKIEAIGIPIRTDLPEKQPEDYHNKTNLTILVMGGSLGSGCINTTICETLPLLKDLANKLHFIHLCGKNIETVQQAYNDHQISATVLSFYHNMPELYEKADIVIARAGGASLAEIKSIGIPSILIPWKNAADEHQLHNANKMKNKNAAIVYTEDIFTKENVLHIIQEFLNTPSRMYVLSMNAKKIGQRNAAYDIAQNLASYLSNL
jgi:UDP-N-acetylglucosamine--N-acetylmuramyl-(pentapeptide) pyrophosphoryl-undecaprenol N-acetylglucosamine transferase